MDLELSTEHHLTALKHTMKEPRCLPPAQDLAHPPESEFTRSYEEAWGFCH